jgi:hypothetical protein
MNIFRTTKVDEACSFAGWQLEPRCVTPKQSGIPTSPWDGVIRSYTTPNILSI